MQSGLMVMGPSEHERVLLWKGGGERVQAGLVAVLGYPDHDVAVVIGR